MLQRTLAFVGVCLLLALGGCTTLSGFGKDIEAIGGGVSGSAAQPH